jgi:hypothetical protein
LLKEAHQPRAVTARAFDREGGHPSCCAQRSSE